jgi:hypothetical protein
VASLGDQHVGITSEIVLVEYQDLHGQALSSAHLLGQQLDHLGKPGGRVDVGEFVELGADAFAVEYAAVVRGDIGAAAGVVRKII